ncbi:MAG: SH3 domain-containing protein, partial [Bdellovibrionales bacterium]|nr:SH3 domain-containing protein [Bdellovibrionales bacterium]
MKKIFLNLHILCLFLFAAGSSKAANKILQTNKTDVIVYAQPQAQAKAVGKLPKGKVVEVVSESRDGFYRVRSKTGKELWIQEQDISPLESITEEILDPPTPGSPAAEAATESEYPKFTIDLGGAAGSRPGVNYTEIQLGTNIYFKKWIAWRNALFGQLATGFETTYGLDSSVRLFAHLVQNDAVALTLFGGPGYRVLNKGTNDGFVEAGFSSRIFF